MSAQLSFMSSRSSIPFQLNRESPERTTTAFANNHSHYKVPETSSSASSSTTTTQAMPFASAEAAAATTTTTTSLRAVPESKASSAPRSLKQMRRADAAASSPASSSALKVPRTIPRSRHSRSPSPSGSSDQAVYMPYKVTAQGFPVNNKLKKGKYATSIDERGYLAVYEFQLNDQTIMWDYTSGFVHLTGIWKALGNSKADIVRLVDNHPELEGVIRRIRGGFLKIQGTWVPFELCKKLAVRTCYPIRHALISVFGPDFPDLCLKPGTKGYGTLTLDDSGVDKQRKKRKPSESVSATAREYKPQSASKYGEREKRPRLAHSLRPRTASLNSQSSQSSGDCVAAFPGQSAQNHATATTTRTVLPPLPTTVDIKMDRGSCPSKTELLDLLNACRSLQKLSSGGGAHAEWVDEGGEFAISGTGVVFHWDGSDNLDLVSSNGSPCTLPGEWDGNQNNQGNNDNDSNGPPELLRILSSSDKDASLYEPLTPPSLPPIFAGDMRAPPPAGDDRGKSWRGDQAAGMMTERHERNVLAPRPIRPLGLHTASSTMNPFKYVD